MKKLFFIFLICLFSLNVFADDVTATVTNSGIGAANGAISLSLSAGYAPYIYSWTGPDGFISSEQNITDLAPGEYCVTVTDNYCGVANLCVTVEEEIQNSIEQNMLFDLQIFPNPANEVLTVVFTNTIPGTYTLKFSDMNGKVVLQKQTFLNSGEQEMELLLQNILGEGAYTFTISNVNHLELSRTVLVIK